MEDPAETTAAEANHGLRCPVCGWHDIRRSRPRGFVDRLVRIVGMVPYRCRSCGQRFYRAQHDLPTAPE